MLATDGGPDCNGSLDPSRCTCVSGASGRCTNATRCLDDARTIERIAAYESRGVPTYVLGIAEDSDGLLVSVLDAMATAGGRASDGDHAYYAARSESELDAALGTIRDQVALCTYLTSYVSDARGHVVLTSDATTIPYDATGVEGWSWADTSNGELVVRGASCDAVRAGTTLRARFVCDE